MTKLLRSLIESAPLQIAATVIVYCMYSALIGVSLVPSLYLLVWGWNAFMTPPSPLTIPVFSFFCGVAFFLYFLTGVFVLGLAIRILSLKIKPGRYPVLSPTMIRWLLYSGIYNVAGTTILSHVPMGFLTILFFKIAGSRIGKNVRINTWHLNDPYLLQIDDEVVIGGKTDISCHTFEKGQLILKPVLIGSGTVIGQGCYISPGVTIGRECVIGQCTLVRKDKVIPDRTVTSAIAGLPIRDAARLEKNTARQVSAV